VPNQSETTDFSGLIIGGRRVVTVLCWSRRSSTQWGVFWTFALVTASVFLFKSDTVVFLWRVIAIFTLGFILWPVVEGTYRLHRFRSVSPRAGYSTIDNLTIAEFRLHQAIALADLGFRLVGCLEKSLTMKRSPRRWPCSFTKRMKTRLTWRSSEAR
jgi:hypothetical protein